MIGHDEFRESFAAGDESPDVAEHRRDCDDCASWAARLEQIVAVAPTVAHESPSIDVTDVVLARTTHKVASARRTRVLVAAAAVAALVAGAAVVASVARDEGSADRLAAVADSYEADGGVRFVYEATATVTLDLDDVAVDVGPPEPIGLVFPTCAAAGDDPQQPSSGGVDLSAIIELLQSDEPCVALAAVSADATDLVDDALATLNGDRRAVLAQQEQLTAMAGGDDLERATIDALAEQRRHDLSRIDGDIARIVDTATAVTASLGPVVDAADAGIDPTGFTAAAQSELDALVALIDEATANQTRVDDATVTWTQLATGQWTPNFVTVDGVITNDAGGDGEVTFVDVASNPLGLADIVLGTPQRLIDVLESAPSADGSMVRWTVPVDVIPAVDGESWTALATLDDSGSLNVLTLTVADIKIEVVPAR